MHYEGDDRAPISCAVLVNAAGLFAPEAAQRIAPLGREHIPEARYAKGHYFTLRGAAPFSHLVYPLPDEHGLGIHVTLDLAGRARFGPDVSWVDGVDYRFEPGRERHFERSIRKYFPGLDERRLSEGYTGIRPKLASAAGGVQDFVVQGADVHGVPGLINLFGIESPGLTAALALAEYVRDRLDA